MRRNLVASLFEHETISTTMEKAKEVKSFAEKLITLGRQGTLQARRRAIALLGNRNIVAEEEGDLVKKGTVIGKLFSEIGPRYLDRPGGYTRIIRLAKRRLGDNGQVVLLQLVGKEETSRPKTKGKGKKKASTKVEKVSETAPVESAANAEAAPASETTDSSGAIQQSNPKP
jgi:large subunit ribosomal protein L17